MSSCLVKAYAQELSFVYTHQHMNKENMVDVHTRDYYSVLKIRDVLLFVATWMDPEDMLGEISRHRKTRSYYLYCVRNLKQLNLESQGRRVVSKKLDVGGRRRVV